MNQRKSCTLYWFSMCCSLLFFSATQAGAVSPNQTVTDLLAFQRISPDTAQVNLKNPVAMAFSSKTGRLYLSIPGNLAVTSEFSGIAVFKTSNSSSWVYETTINDKQNGQNLLIEPTGLELANNDALMLISDQAKEAIILLENKTEKLDSQSWLLHLTLDTAAEASLASPRQLSLNENTQSIYVISNQAREWYFWQCEQGFTSCDQGHRVTVPGRLSAIDSSDEVNQVVVGDQENHQLIVYRHQPLTNEMAVIQIISRSSENLQWLLFPSAILLSNHGQLLLVTAKAGNSLFVFANTGTEYSLQQQFGADQDGEERLNDFIAPTSLAMGTSHFDYQPLYISAEISSSITVLHRLKGESAWQYYKTLKNEEVMNSRGISHMAILPPEFEYLASIGAHSEDLVIYQVSARPAFDASSYEFEYYENGEPVLGQIDVSDPDGGMIVQRTVEVQNQDGNYTIDWQEDNELALHSEELTENIPSPIILTLTAFDAENQTTSANASVFVYPVPDVNAEHYYISGVVFGIASLLGAGAVAVVTCYKCHQRDQGDYSPKTMEKRGHIRISIEGPEPADLQDQNCMTVAMPVVANRQDQILNNAGNALQSESHLNEESSDSLAVAIEEALSYALFPETQPVLANADTVTDFAIMPSPMSHKESPAPVQPSSLLTKASIPDSELEVTASVEAKSGTESDTAITPSPTSRDKSATFVSVRTSRSSAIEPQACSQAGLPNTYLRDIPESIVASMSVYHEQTISKIEREYQESIASTRMAGSLQVPAQSQTSPTSTSTSTPTPTNNN